MANKSESVMAHDIPNADWDTPFTSSPSASVGEFSRRGANPVVPDLYATSFSETARTPVDGDMSRSEGKFPTRSSGKTS